MSIYAQKGQNMTDIRVREDPFYMSELRIDFEHVSNGLPTIAGVA